MSIRITELDAITSLQSGDYIAVDNESTGTHKFDALNIGANIGQNIANTYSSSASYAIGQYCLYDNNLYKCITTISTPEAWNSSHWIQVTVGEGLYEKVDKVSGKGLSTNDFTDEYKQKLGGIEAGAEVNVQANWAETNTSSDDYIKNKPGNATTEISGFMSASDKQKLDNIASGAEVNVQANWTETDSSKDDYIKNKPTIDDALSTSSTNAVENSAIATAINNEATTRENADNALDGRIDTIEEILPNKANINGSYEEMTVGSAEQLISTESMEDSKPYIFRKSGNGADIGDRETDMLVGGTVAWNQLSKERMAQQTQNGITSTYSGGVFTLSGTATSTYTNNTESVYLITDHVYYQRLNIIANPNSVSFKAGSLNGGLPLINADAPTNVYKVSVSSRSVSMGIQNITTGSVMDGIKYSYNIFDLTQMFGSTIADAIYAMEQAEAGSGIAWFRHYFPNPYYAYNAGSLQSVNVASHDMTGFNQWDEEWRNGRYDSDTGVYISVDSYFANKNPIKVLPNTAYHIRSDGNITWNIFCYRSDNTFIERIQKTNATFTTPFDCAYINFSGATQAYGTTYKGDICINISDDNRNGEYEEYVIHSYPYDETVELRGVPQLVDEELKYDGDTYESNGKVTRKYGIVDLGTLSWSYNSSDIVFYANLDTCKRNTLNGLCSKYPIADFASGSSNMSDKTMVLGTGYVGSGHSTILVKDSSYTVAADFKTAMSGVYLVYELATSTEEEAEGFINPQIVDASGTEEYVDAGVKNNTRDVAIPVGHITQYIVNLRDKLQHLPFLAKEDGDYFVNQTGTQMSLKKIEGYYEDLVVGVADNLSTDIRTNDQTPYLFRTSGGSVDIGDREYINSVVGGTIAWNQICGQNARSVPSWGVAYDSTTKKYTISGTYTFASALWLDNVPTVNGHKYLASCTDSTMKMYFVSTANVFYGGTIVSANSSTGYIGIAPQEEKAFNNIFQLNIIDLTQLFGSTIADYIYSLETANAGVGVAYFRKLFPKPFYEYNSGELLSVSGLQSHDMVGFNMCNETPTIGWFWNNGVIDKNRNSHYAAIEGKIRGVPSTTYCIALPNKSTNNITAYLSCFDADGNPNGSVYSTITSNKTSVRLTTSANCYSFIVQFYVGGSSFTVNDFSNICINLSWDGSRDGEYEPYQKWSYPLDSSLELRGIPKLDSNNNLYYDGDTYAPDGTVTRRYGVVDLGSLTWTIYNADRGLYRAPLGLKIVETTAIPNMVCPKYQTVSQQTSWVNGQISNVIVSSLAYLIICDTSYADLEAFKTAMNGIYLVYELATPTTESAEPYTNPQIVDDFGTEEYVIDSTIDVPIPVGHDTDYPINLKSKLEMAPDSPDGDGDYIVRQTNGTNEYVPLIIEDQLPAVPSTDGTYTLTVTIANGEATYSWT